MSVRTIKLCTVGHNTKVIRHQQNLIDLTFTNVELSDVRLAIGPELFRQFSKHNGALQC